MQKGGQLNGSPTSYVLTHNDLQFSSEQISLNHISIRTHKF